MTKLIIQIPCLNEEETLATTLASLPRRLDGIDEIEWLVIDDGSTDNTIKVAKENGADHIVQLYHNQGLAKAFMVGIDYCLRNGADIIVNTDADNQYDASCIPALIEPILNGKAEIVIGDRQVALTDHFSMVKKLLQRLGSSIVRILSNTGVPDAPSGFRAIHRRAAVRLNVFNEYTYTLETIIQAGQKNMPVTWVPIRTNRELRPSRLVKSITSYVTQSIIIMMRIFMIYRPLRFFAALGAMIMLPGLLLGIRYLWLIAAGHGAGNVQSLILAAIFLMAGFFVIVAGLLADLISVNRKLLEELRSRLMNLEHSLLVDDVNKSAVRNDFGTEVSR